MEKNGFVQNEEKYMKGYNNMNSKDELKPICNSDGEVIGLFKDPIITERETLESRKAYFEKQKNIEIRKDSIGYRSQELGGIVWNRYRVSDEYLNISKPSSLTRLIFLSTYLYYDGTLKYDNGRLMTFKSLNKVLKLSQKEFYTFMNEMKTLQIISGDDDTGWKINPNVFYKGELPKQKIKEESELGWYYMRLYCGAIRSLYNQATTRSHKTLSYIFQIIPYVNRRYNIVCWNPLETDLYKIERMTLGEYCDLIGYDRGNARRLMKTLFDPTFKIDDEIETSVIRFVCNKYKEYETYEIFLNPRVYYAGDDWERVEVLGGF